MILSPLLQWVLASLQFVECPLCSAADLPAHLNSRSQLPPHLSFKSVSALQPWFPDRFSSSVIQLCLLSLIRFFSNCLISFIEALADFLQNRPLSFSSQPVIPEQIRWRKEYAQQLLHEILAWSSMSEHFCILHMILCCLWMNHLFCLSRIATAVHCGTWLPGSNKGTLPALCLQLAICFQFVWVSLTCWKPYLGPPCDDLIMRDRMCSRGDCSPRDSVSPCNNAFTCLRSNSHSLVIQ